jgi:hypothetical protein
VTAPDATLTGRLREALGEHASVRGFDEIGQWFSHACACSWHGQSDADHCAHVADVAAQTVAAWLREQRETVAEESRAGYYGPARGYQWHELTDGSKRGWRDAADAALAALVAAIGGAE